MTEDKLLAIVELMTSPEATRYCWEVRNYEQHKEFIFYDRLTGWPVSTYVIKPNEPIKIKRNQNEQ